MSYDQEKNQPESEEKPLNKKEVEFKNKSLSEKICYLKSNITVEPILAGLVIPSMLARLAMQNLNLDKACRLKLRYGDEICNALIEREGNMSYYEGEVQRVVSSIEAWKSVLSTSIPTILMIVMGAWSDRTGNRKICILAPIVGEFMVCISNIFSTAFFYEIPVEATMFFEAFFPAITGGWVMVYLGVFSYISDITTADSRTFRVGLVNLCLTAGIPIGTSLSGILLKLTGYYGIFAISAAINLITFLYGYFCLDNNTKPGHETGNDKKKPWSFMDLVSMVKETVEVAFKKRDGIFRKKIILTLLVVIIIYGPDHGERIITYLFVRYRLKWGALKYSFYSTYSIITHSLVSGNGLSTIMTVHDYFLVLLTAILGGALFSLSVFSKRWGWHDSMLCLISILSKFIGSIYFSLVQNDLQMFMLPIVEILNATTFTSLRSMASKLVESEEMGKMNSLFSLVETLAALVFDPAYSKMYSYTVTVFSGTVFMFSAFMALPAISILLWIFIKHRQESKENRSLEILKKIDKQDLAKPEKGMEKTEISSI